MLHLNIALYGAEVWTLGEKDPKHVEKSGAGEGWKFDRSCEKRRRPGEKEYNMNNYVKEG